MDLDNEKENVETEAETDTNTAGDSDKNNESFESCHELQLEDEDPEEIAEENVENQVEKVTGLWWTY